MGQHGFRRRARATASKREKTMNMETYFAFVLFVIVMTGTPGMGNLSMMSIGQTTGYRSSLPFLAGLLVGEAVLNLMVALGLGGLYMARPEVAWIMKIGGLAYICYLGWKIMAMHVGGPDSNQRFTFRDGLFLHPTNPKSWAMAVVGFSQIAHPEGSLTVQTAIFMATFAFFAFTFHSLWGLVGTVLMRTLKSRSVLVGVNLTMVTVMIGATAYAMFA